MLLRILPVLVTLATPALAGDFPGGVIDPAGRHAFVTDPEGHTVALALRSGKQLWRSASPGRPLAYASGAVAVLGKEDGVRVVLLDPGTGKVRRRSEPIVLPEWVQVPPPSVEGHHFEAEAIVEDAALRLTWRASRSYVGGAPPPPDVLEEANREAEGAVRVALVSGAVTPAEVPAVPGETGDFEVPPFEVDAKRYAVERRFEGGRERLLLEGPEPRRELASGSALVAVLSTDRRHVLVQAEGGPWQVVEVAGGQRIGKLSLPPAFEAVLVRDGRAYVLVRRNAADWLETRIEASDLRSGRRRWSYRVSRERIPLPRP